MDSSQTRIEALIRDLSHKSEDVRWGAAFTLVGQIGDQRAVHPLIKTLRDGDWSVRMRAAESLGKLRARNATEALLLQLRDENPDVRRHTVAALTHIADPASSDRLGDALKDPDWRVRMGAALALAAIGDRQSLGYLETAVRDENEFVRKIAEAIVVPLKVSPFCIRREPGCFRICFKI